ncbi:hypothetical protein Tco_1363078 [Tanacetum coccineum]
MANLIFADSHNMVAYLEKSEDNVDFVEVVDFLNVSPIRFALTVSPTVYVSYIEQFWSTAKIKTVNNETQIRAKVDGKTIVITESSVRRDLHFNDEDGITCLTNTKIFENLQLMGFLQLFLNNQIENLTAVFNDEYDTPSHTKKIFANMRRQEKDFSGTVTPLFATMLIQSQAVDGKGSGQPTEPQHTPTTASPSHVEPIPIVASSSQPKKTQKHRTTKRKATKICQSSGHTTLVADETIHEERRDSVERVTTTATSLDAELGSGNINRTQSTAIPNDPFPQGIGSGGSIRCQEAMRDIIAQTKVLDLENVKDAQALKIKRLKKRDASKEGRSEIDQDEGISWFQEDSKTQGRYGHDIGVNTASTSITTANINITASEPVTTAGVSVSTAEPSTHTITTTTMTHIEDEDLTIAQTLMKMKSEKSKAKRVTIEVEASKAANIAEWDNVQAMIDADYELATKLQAEEQGEISIEERSKLFMELMNERNKHFARLRAEDHRRKPLTKAQKRNQMSNYLKNMTGYTL